MNKEQFPTLLRFFKALADESRLKILGILANQECSVEELAALLQLKEPTVSHHLSRLKALDLVNMRSEGNTHLYQLNHKALQNISKDIFTPEKMAALVADLDNNAWENKVLQNYFAGNITNSESVRLRELPTSRKKRQVVLSWLANKFEVGVNYPEATVNEILEVYYPDYATLRRGLIEYNFMQQQNDMYSRTVEAIEC